ncbi:hypothetical protein G9A89_017546 [Geosiphon pyriformis]|nr:hypothetical protein G9A89_017546 [Geosiphon pyriformis]
MNNSSQATEDAESLALAVLLQNEEYTAPSETTEYADNGLIDPNPDLHSLFLAFNDQFFWGKLACVEVRWSTKMTLCAGLCEFKNGFVSIRLSEPLLKFRPRSDMVETLLHEMIHALNFLEYTITDRNGHGEKFLVHMQRINAAAGTSITVYHDFNDEVNYYRTHIWKCNGPCQERSPFYGLVKRSMNRPPQPADRWWHSHQVNCGGIFNKIAEPIKEEKKRKSKINEDNKQNEEMKKSGSKTLAYKRQRKGNRKLDDFFAPSNPKQKQSESREYANNVQIQHNLENKVDPILLETNASNKPPIDNPQCIRAADKESNTLDSWFTRINQSPKKFFESEEVAAINSDQTNTSTSRDIALNIVRNEKIDRGDSSKSDWGPGYRLDRAPKSWMDREKQIGHDKSEQVVHYDQSNRAI